MRSLIALGLLGSLLIFTFSPAPPGVARAAETKATASFQAAELDQLIAPIALYPDELLTQVLTAATYPLEIVIASRWVAEPKNAKLKGDALAKALKAQSWDASVRSLAYFPSVLKMMSDRLDWTRKLGDAFLAQPKDCLATVQRLRQRAKAAGTLASTKQQKVVTQGQTIIIQPADPQVVYVPAYNPTVVYGTWPYPSYPPYYYPPPPGYAFATGVALGFAVGIAVNNNYWGWGRPNWHTGDININVNRWNQINANKTTIAGNTWRHNSVHRDGVPYRNAATRQRYGRQAPGTAAARRNYRGYRTTATRPNTRATRPPASRGVKTQPAGSYSRRTNSLPANRPTAFNPGRGTSARADSLRGRASRQQMGSFGGRSSGGGGSGFRGGSGGRRGGFRR